MGNNIWRKNIYSNWIFITLQSTLQETSTRAVYILWRPMLQELSTSTSNELTTRSTNLAIQATWLPSWSNRQSTKKAVQANSIEHSPWSRQASEVDPKLVKIQPAVSSSKNGWLSRKLESHDQIDYQFFLEQPGIDLVLWELLKQSVISKAA